MVSKDVYCPYKVAHHREKLEMLKEGTLPTPTNIQIDLTNICNLRCKFCFYHIMPLNDYRKDATLKTETVYKLLSDLKKMGIPCLEWTGGGSIECHPDYKKIIARANKLGFRQSLVTNGTLLDDEAIDLIKDFDWIRVSIDASTPMTYKKLKGVDLFDRSIENSIKLKNTKTENLVLGSSFIVHPINHKEIYDFCRMSRDLGFDNSRISLAMTPQRDKLFDGIWEECLQQINETNKLNSKDFRIFAFQNRINELSLKNLSEYCGYHHFVGVVSPSGIYPCCRLKDDAKYNFGNLENQSFEEIWYGQKRRDFIKLIENGCPFDCWMTEKNKFIKYLLSDDPDHVNFI